VKKLKIAAFLSALCVLLLCGCQPIASWLSYLSDDTFDAHKYQAEFSHHWQYNQLSAEEKVYYGCLYTAVTDSYATDTFITYTDETQQSIQKPGIRVAMPGAQLTNDSITRLYEAFFADNPQFFYLDRTYSMEGRQQINGGTYYNALIIQYTLPTEQRVLAHEQLQDVVNDIIADLPQTADEYETELFLHDQLTALCTYDTAAAEAESTAAPNAYTSYGALVEGKAVCEGYAKAMQLLLHKASIPVTLVTGVARESSEAHMWNMVTINGENYHLDPTWNDTNDQQQHTFFNLTTEMINISCTIDTQQDIPLCTATKDNAFVRKDTVIDTYERQVIAEKIAARIRAGETTIQLRFVDGKYENGILFLKNKKLMSTMVNNHLAATGLTMWDYELWAESGHKVLTLIQK